ncbi:MAG: NAD(P)H-dependent oxidoreductase [Bacteroidetes bacterium]|nr:NAD(P)H-dependent oxidoreductase [Bacteroidota bacterium]
MKLIAFAGSNSSTSINKKLATYAATQFKDSEVEVLDLNDFELPLFSVDREKVLGQPKLAHDFLNKMKSADLLVVSMAENNRNYSVAFKNITDWASRIDVNIFAGKPMLLMATSPGARGGASVLEIAEKYFPRYGAKILKTFSLPSFEENFKDGEGIVNEDLKNKLLQLIKEIQNEQV